MWLRLRDDDRLEVWNAKHASWIGVTVGSFLRVDTPGDVYPIDRQTFLSTYYEPVVD